MELKVAVSPGELIDKITILQIKSERIEDAPKRQNVLVELGILDQEKTSSIPKSKELDALSNQLKQVNSELWDIEDDIRDKERNKEFDEIFIELARSVYITNDKRARLKKEINVLLSSKIVEEKSYSDY